MQQRLFARTASGCEVPGAADHAVPVKPVRALVREIGRADESDMDAVLRDEAVERIRTAMQAAARERPTDS